MNDMDKYRSALESRLNALLDPVVSRDDWLPIRGTVSPILSDAMRYSLIGNGKRIRPLLFLTSIEKLGGNAMQALDFACAIEMIHTYSLIHDDLPGMDNDTLRRGKKTNHVVFGEGQAILAGDGLLNYAYEVMLAALLSLVSDKERNRFASAMKDISAGAGITGMISGQAEDLYTDDLEAISFEHFEYIQCGKTAAMFAFPLRAAGQISGQSEDTLHDLYNLGIAYGLLFQATDDLLDVTGKTEDLGKTTGKDAKSEKKSCISMLGLDGTIWRVHELRDRAETFARAAFGCNSDFMIELLDKTVNRHS